MTAELVTEPKSKTHRWERDGAGSKIVRRIHSSESVDGNDRSERTCTECGLVQITVHPTFGYSWREWRTADGKEWHGSATPPCIVREVVEPRKVAIK